MATAVGRSAYDLLEAVASGDKLCAVVSGVKLTADLVRIAASSFAKKLNVTSLVTVLISYGCRFFVFFCKRGNFTWGCRKWIRI